MESRDICIIDLSASAEEVNATIAKTDLPLVGFADPQAKNPEAYFTKLAEAFERYPDVDVAQGRIAASHGMLSLSRILPEEECVVDVDQRFSHALIYPYGMLCRTSALRASGVRFDASLEFCRDELFALQLCQRMPQRVHMPACKYRTGHVFDESSPVTPQASEKRWYFDSTLPLLSALEGEGGVLAQSSQYGLLYLLVQRFKSNENMNVKIVFDDVAQTEEYMAQAARVLRSVEDTVLFDHDKVPLWERNKLLYLGRMRAFGTDAPDPAVELRVKPGNVRVFFEGSTAKGAICKLQNQCVRLQAMRYAEDGSGRPGLDIDLRMEVNVPTDLYEIVFTNTYDGKTHEYRAEVTGRIGGMNAYFDHVAYTLPSFKVFVPLAKKPAQQDIRVSVLCGGERLEMGNVKPWKMWQSRLRADCPAAYWVLPNGLVVRGVPGGLRIEQAGAFRLRKLEREYQAWLSKSKSCSKRMLLLRKLYFKTRRSYRNRRIWVYYDKGFKGGDNGEYAFRYAAAQDDGIEHVYVIGADTEDGKRLAAEGFKTVEPGTTEALLTALNAEVIFATHVPVYRKIGLNKDNVEVFKDVMRAKIVRLYHGFPITRDISYTQFYADYAAVAVGSTYERELYTGADNGFTPEQVIGSSMPRYDGLVPDDRRQILFAPTWRPSCRGEVSKNGESLYNPDFKDSLYYKRYEQIMYDPRLLATAREHGYKIKMFLHPRMAPQTVDFEKNDVVQALDCTKDTDYVTIMRQSSLMVTDYSSVMVDFAYMRKPVVYYQDEALPYWRFTNFDYEDIGFGEVVKDPDELVRLLCAYIERDCALEERYLERINDFFLYDDLHGAKRLYEAVRKMTD